MVGQRVKAKQTPKPPGKLTNYAIPPDVFVAAWEAAATIQEVYKALKKHSEAQGTPVMPPAIIAARAAEYRRTLPLKRMPRISARTLDAKALTAVVAKVRAENGAAPSQNDEPVLTRAQVEEVVVEVLKKYGLVK